MSSATLRTVTYPACPAALPTTRLVEGRYEVRFAQDERELDQILALRYEVFNLELGEGLEESHITGRDRDAFDDTCHHLIVSETATGRIVGTYRMQTAEMARAGAGFYSDGEFDLAHLPTDVVDRSIELGRACIARDSRNSLVLFALWRGLSAYLAWNDKRLLFGCCSLTSQDPEEGLLMRRLLERRGVVHPSLRVPVRPASVCYDPGQEPAAERSVSVPTLFNTYLRFGGKVISEAAIDREFKTIDFLIVLDVAELSPRSRETFFRGLRVPSP